MNKKIENYVKSVEAIEEGRAENLMKYADISEKRIDTLYYKRPQAALASGCREHFYLGFLAALDYLGADEMLSTDQRADLARSLTVEARKFLVDRDVISPSAWMK